MSLGKRKLNIGILLEDNKNDKQRMRDIIASDSSLDYVIEPKNVEQMFAYIRRLAQQGKRISKLVFIGHGNRTNHHIGMLQPADVDIEAVTRQRKNFLRAYENAKKTIKALQKQLKSTTDAKKKDLQQQLENERDRFIAARDNYNESVKKFRSLKELANAMDKNAVVGLINCYAAGDANGRRMMRNLGKLFLHKRGGQIIGWEGSIWTNYFWVWLTGIGDIKARPWGRCVRYRVRPKSSRCGAPCVNFERYGYCDRPASANGGPCWMHQ